MKKIAILLAVSALAATSFVTDKVDPEAAGMAPTRLARIRVCMKEYVDAGKTAGSIKAGFAPGAGHGFGFEVVRETLGTYRYNSIGSFVKGGAYRTYGFVDPSKDLVGIILMQRTNGGGDVADEINSFLALAAAAIER